MQMPTLTVHMTIRTLTNNRVTTAQTQQILLNFQADFRPQNIGKKLNYTCKL